MIHLAGLSNDPLGDLDPDLTVEINERASIRLARLAREAGVERFVFSSSCSTYGAAGDDLLDESARFNPVTPYGRSKVRMEEALAELADQRFSPVYLRNATACGVSPRLRLDLVLNNLVGWAHTTGEVRLLSDGSPWRPLVHVEDIWLAFLAALEAPREAIHDQAFNVGRTDENFRIRELAEIVAETVPGCEVEVAEGAGPDKRTYRVDFGKIETELPGFAPRWTVRRAARELYDAYCRIGLSAEDFDGPSFKRLATSSACSRPTACRATCAGARPPRPLPPAEAARGDLRIPCDGSTGGPPPRARGAAALGLNVARSRDYYSPLPVRARAGANPRALGPAERDAGVEWDLAAMRARSSAWSPTTAPS